MTDGPRPPQSVRSSCGSPDFDEIVAALRTAGCVFAEEEAHMLMAESARPADLARNVRRRVEGVPLEYILGWAEFAGLRILVDPGVFVPRRRTELLVDQALDILSAHPASEPPIVVDLCCGSGAVGAAIIQALPEADVHAADIDATAAQCARRNIEPLGGRVHRGDLFEAIPSALRGRVRLFAVNAPYVPTEAIRTMPPEARVYEPVISLDGGEDGLDFHRRVAAGSIEWLAHEGYLLIETSERQAAETSAILAAAGFAVRTARSDEVDGTVVVGRLLPGVTRG